MVRTAVATLVILGLFASPAVADDDHDDGHEHGPSEGVVEVDVRSSVGRPRNPRGFTYVFPFSGRRVTYARDHLDYPATDVYGCGALVLAPTDGLVVGTTRKDEWSRENDREGTRGGKTVTIVGRDTVRYFFSHLGMVNVRKGQRVTAGQRIGVMGSSGNAQKSHCHTHIGISRNCIYAETELLRGEIWPWRFLDAWSRGVHLSPRKAKNRLLQMSPNGCDEAVKSHRLRQQGGTVPPRDRP